MALFKNKYTPRCEMQFGEMQLSFSVKTSCEENQEIVKGQGQTRIHMYASPRTNNQDRS